MGGGTVTDSTTPTTHLGVVAPSADLTNNIIDVCVSVTPDVGTVRTPLSLCCVVDVSGSMSSEAKAQNQAGVVEVDGLNILDVVKHSLKTIIGSLSENDNLSLVTFSHTAETIFTFTKMNKKGKKMAVEKVSSLEAGGQTNLYDGLKTGLELVRLREKPQESMAAIMLLTDGLPNVAPPSGHMPALNRYLDQYPLTCSINTFGFGYSLESQLLNELAEVGNGMYSFIPDSGFVGTVFVNSVANLLSTVATGTTLSLSPLQDCSIVPASCLVYPCVEATWGNEIKLGPLRYGQSQDLVFKMAVSKEFNPAEPIVEINLKLQGQCSPAPTSIQITTRMGEPNDSLTLFHTTRLQMIDTIASILTSFRKNKNLKSAQELLDQLIKRTKQKMSQDKSPERVNALMEDMQGQVSEAISKLEYFSKWGIHYLPSLGRAHFLQLCNNFKDPGVQIYGDDMFRKLRDELEDIFMKLPPPVPSPRAQAMGYTAPVSMTRYYNASSG
eukprot:Lithocolla_globosa_v1_NODE_3438_length_1668_cov_44.847489.p1 type:complete len:497 gc:universal NODE_3438_length_1668_cov_44.847489:57-1547(+)